MVDGIKVVALPTRPRLAVAGDGQPPIADRLAQLLTEICETPLISLPSDGGPPNRHDNARRPLELRLAHVNPDLAERAAALLEEAGW